MFISGEIIQKLQERDISVLKGYAPNDKVAVYFNSDEKISDFINFAHALGKKYIFMDIDLYEDDENKPITNELLERYGSPQLSIPEFKKAIDEFNNKMEKMKNRVSEELSVNLYLPHDGVIYCLSLEDDDLYIEAPDDFLEQLVEDYDEEIAEIRSNQRKEELNLFNEHKKEIERIITSDDDFKYYSTKDMRMNFSHRLYEAYQEYFKSINLKVYQLTDMVEVVWKKRKESNL